MPRSLPADPLFCNEQADRLGNVLIPESFNEEARISAEKAIKESFIFGFSWAIGLRALLALTGALLSLATIHSPPHRDKFSPGEDIAG